MIERSFTVERLPRVEVHAASATIAIDPSVTDTQVDVRVDTDRPDDWTVRQTGSTVLVRVERDRLFRRREHVHVRLPAGSELDVRTASGDVTAAVDLGRVELTTASGDVQLTAARTVSLNTASGDVTIERITGDLSARSASGDVAAHDVRGALTATTAAGDVRIGELHGELHATTAAGDVTVDRYLGGEVDVRTMAGDVSLGMPTGTTVDLDVRTLAGRVHLPPPQPDGAADGGGEHRGTVTVTVRSASGDVELRRLAA